MPRAERRARKTGPRKASRSRPRRRRLRRLAAPIARAWRVRPVRYVALLGAAGLLVWLLLPLWSVTGQLSAAPRQQPSRLFAAPVRIDADDPLRGRDLVALLEERGYRPAAGAEGPLARGTYRSTGSREAGGLEVMLRSFPTAAGWTVPSRLEVASRRGVVERLALDSEEVPSVLLDPLLLTSYYGSRLLDRWPERFEELPEHVWRAVLAAEDATFFRHPGLSLTGILRALLIDLEGRELSHGGSTITQQLVKNIYLTHERTVARKVREAFLSVVVELRYSKQTLLQAYLNEIFLGRSGSVNVMGIGSAARVYFGVPATELSLSEAATLAGIIRSPANLSPRLHPERAIERRDTVLRRMRELEWIDQAQLESALAEALVTGGRPISRQVARFAADAAAAEVRERFGIRGLEDAGYTIVSTLERPDQDAAEDAVAWGLGALEAGWQKGVEEARLEGALVSIDPRDGRVLAWVGGRDYGESQFDRVRMARRQVGSAFKPVVLAAAFSTRAATPADVLVDEPITVVQAGREWSPNNDDRRFRGRVSVRESIEQSLNVPTVRLAIDVGLPRIVETARALGVSSPLESVPSMALGSFEMTPEELLRAYATFASGGVRPAIYMVDGVLDRRGESLEGRPLPPAEQVIEPGVAYLVTSVLEGVVDHGTGRRLRQDGLRDVLAGKSGTTNGGRDSWFIGYSPERATLAWVGYDSNRATRLSGSRAALPIWGRFVLSRRPRGGYRVALPPPEVTTRSIDPATGQLATGRCPEVVTEVFLRDDVPSEECEMHDRSGRRWWRFWGRERRRSSGGE
ncbi:MAG TPA: transglycosylase domain-containing protein [Thermoanaerobaculia bacterium]|nr:transglycosylase domain-containing protein [Thermoanaerobaculia bacterium]